MNYYLDTVTVAGHIAINFYSAFQPTQCIIRNFKNVYLNRMPNVDKTEDIKNLTMGALGLIANLGLKVFCEDFWESHCVTFKTAALIGISSSLISEIFSRGYSYSFAISFAIPFPN